MLDLSYGLVRDQMMLGLYRMRIIVHPYVARPIILNIDGSPAIYTPSMDVLRTQLDKEADEAKQPRIDWGDLSLPHPTVIGSPKGVL